MKHPYVDRFAETIPLRQAESIAKASERVTSARADQLSGTFIDPNKARRTAGEIKQEVVLNLRTYLEQFEKSAKANGIQVHWAETPAEANDRIVSLCKQHADGRPIVKAKSMATEEIHLNDALQAAGLTPIETDLGEFVIQLENDKPAHIVLPLVHRDRHDVSKSFEERGIGPKTEEPKELTHQAREHLRQVFQEAQVGISGVNFAIAETGRLVLIENEGNSRLSTTSPRVHIALMGIEKILPSERHLPLFLRLLTASATGQRANVYTHWITGPRQPDESDGPEEVHLVLLDNGRSTVASSEYKSILRCIRCGACMFACPVFRRTGGHAYRNVYPGPLGAVLAPGLQGLEAMHDLANASSLCGACQEACPVNIPIPEMLLHLRRDAQEAGLSPSPVPWGSFARAASSSGMWSLALRLLPLAGAIPNPLMSAWSRHRSKPRREGRRFRRWWNGRA